MTLRKGRSIRSILTALVLLAFSVQSFLIQTHIHTRFLAAPIQVSGVTVQRNTTAPFDLDHCVLCQEYVHSGTFLTPAAVAVLPPSAQISLLPFVLAPATAAREVSHIWMGRAPPRA